MKQVVLLRVGVDSGCGGIQGPLFDDGTFEFICIPAGRKDGDTYGSRVGRYGRPWLDFFPESQRLRVAKHCIHDDPEFETFTYGDPTRPKRSLRKLKRGDFLVLYCGLQQWDAENEFNDDPRPALYLAGYFEVEKVSVGELDRNKLLKDFRNNYHVRHKAVFELDKERLIVIKGGPGSRLFRKAFKISSEGKNKLGKPLKVLSKEMRKIFGTFGGVNSIERSLPRWVKPAFVDGAIRFLKERTWER